MARRFVVVCGYGCNLNSPLKPYLDRVVAYLKETGIREVIFCGGYTQRKSFPGTCEAGVMARYVEARVSDVVAMWENGSYTAYDNIKAAAELIRRTQPDAWTPRVTVFCEATRALKVDILVRHFMPRKDDELPIHVETDSWELGSPIKELWAAFLALLATKFPIVNTYQRRKNIAKSKNR
jgi:hypothetical protein